MSTRPMTNREFTLLAVVSVLAILGFAAWLDRDMLDPAPELRVSQVQAEETNLYELGIAEGRRQTEAKAMQIYQQGLQEGAEGAVDAVRGRRGVPALQACLALGYAAPQLHAAR